MAPKDPILMRYVSITVSKSSAVFTCRTRTKAFSSLAFSSQPFGKYLLISLVSFIILLFYRIFPLFQPFFYLYAGGTLSPRPPEVYPLRSIRFRERQRLTAAALHRITSQPASGRSSALPCLAALGVYPNISTLKPFTRFIRQTYKIERTILKGVSEQEHAQL